MKKGHTRKHFHSMDTNNWCLLNTYRSVLLAMYNVLITVAK